MFHVFASTEGKNIRKQLFLETINSPRCTVRSLLKHSQVAHEIAKDKRFGSVSEKKEILLKRRPHLKHVVKEMHFMATEPRRKQKGRSNHNRSRPPVRINDDGHLQQKQILRAGALRRGEAIPTLGEAIQKRLSVLAKLGRLLRRLYNVQKQEQENDDSDRKDAWILNMKVRRASLGRPHINHDAPGFKVLDQLSKVIAELFNRPKSSFSQDDLLVELNKWLFNRPKSSFSQDDLLVELNKWFTGPGITCWRSSAWDFYCGEKRDLNIEHVKAYVIGCKEIYTYLGGDLYHLILVSSINLK